MFSCRGDESTVVTKVRKLKSIWVSKGRREIAADDGQAWQAEILHIIRSEISRVTLGKVWVLC